MKIENNPDYNRAPFVVGLPDRFNTLAGGIIIPEVSNHHSGQLNITIGYVSDSNPPACKAVLLDSIIIPEIIKRFNAHNELVSALTQLLYDHRAMVTQQYSRNGKIRHGDLPVQAAAQKALDSIA